MTTDTPTKNVRLTITVTPEVHQIFTRFAKAASMPVGRAMGEWLGDTIDAAAFTAKKMEEARAAPALVSRELHAYALGLADEAGAIMDKMRSDGQQARARTGASGPGTATAAQTTPPSNTGVTTIKNKPTARKTKG
jgi:hypothetical protein